MIALFKKRRTHRAGLSDPRDGISLSFPNADTIQVRHSAAFANRDSELCRSFLNRVFAIKEVSYVQIDPSRGEAQIRYQVNGSHEPAILAQIATALQAKSRRRDETAGHLHLGGKRPSPLRVYRHGTTVSTWEVVHELPGRVRLRHEQLYGRRRAARHLQQELGTIFGVFETKAAYRTGTVLIHFNDQAVKTSQLLQIVEGMLHDFDNPKERGYVHPEAGTAATNSTLALAALGEFAAPILLPMSGVLLVLTNVDTIASAWRELRNKRLGLSVLYVLIVAATIATGGFFTAALMSWFIHYWDRRSHRQLSKVQSELLADFRRTTRFAWLCRDDVELEVAADRLLPGDTVVVRTGEMIPADGVVTAGHAEVDERLVRGVQGMTQKAVGDPVYASSLIFAGSLKLIVGKSGDQTRAASIVRAIEDASTPSHDHLKIRGKPFAERTVAPTLAAAGVGLAVGDLGTALAILRPDYWSGPGMSGPLGTLHDVVSCAHRGVVVRDSAALQRFSESKVVLIDLRCIVEEHRSPQPNSSDGSPNVLHEMAQGLRKLRRGNSLRVGLISEGRQSDVARCAEFLGVDFFESGLSPDAKTQLIRDHGEQGQRVAFVGDCLAHEQAARHAHLAISTGDIAHLESDPGQIFLLGSQLSKLHELGEVARNRTRRQRVHESCTMLPNLVCVAGAFALGFTSLHTVLITNLGVYTVYRSGTKWLQRLQRQQTQPTLSSVGGFDHEISPRTVT